MKKTINYCDICEKEVGFNYIIVEIKIGDRRKHADLGSWNYKNNYEIIE